MEKMREISSMLSMIVPPGVWSSNEGRMAYHPTEKQVRMAIAMNILFPDVAPDKKIKALLKSGELVDASVEMGIENVKEIHVSYGYFDFEDNSAKALLSRITLNPKLYKLDQLSD